MPSSGYIKIRQWNSVAYSSGALSGITANATGPDRVGWIEVVGNEQTGSAGVITLNGLGNPTSPQFRGQPFLIGTTPGTPARTDTYQIPSNGNNVYFPGVWVEKTSGSDDYEFYSTTTSPALVSDIATDRRRGKYCWVATDGTLRFGHDGTNSTGGFVPPANCKIITGNIFLTMAPNATPTVNSLNAAATTRYRFGGSSLPNLTMDWVTCNWYFGASLYGKITFTNSSFVGHTVIQQPGEVVTITKCGWGAPLQCTGTGMLDLVQCAYGSVLTDCYFNYGVFGATTRSSIRSNISRGLTILRCEFGFTGTRTTTGNHAMLLTSTSNADIRDCVIGGTVSHTSGSNIVFSGDNEVWYDHQDYVNVGTTITTGFTFSTSADTLIEDITFPIPGQLPRAGLFSTTSGIRNTVRNIGSYDTPYDFTIYEEKDATWARVTTTCTVTTASPHGLSTGHRATVYVSDNTAGIPLGNKDLTVTGSNTFTFTCLNSGATSGVLSFYGACSSGVLFTVASTNTEKCKVHNVHFAGNTNALFSIDATAIDTEFKNVSGDPNYVFAPTIPGTNSILRSIQTGSTPSTSNAVLGTHWTDFFVCGEGDQPHATGVSWARSAGTITVTAPDHGLRTNDLIQTYDSSNPAGARQNLASVSVINEDTFTYSGANSGTTSGTISYRTNEGVIFILMNAPISSTASQAQITAGSPAFTGLGTLAAFNPGDQIEWESPDWILGHDHFPCMWPSFPSSGGNPLNNTDLIYRLDRGSGYSSWHNLHVKRSNGAGTSGANTITVDDTTGLAVGDYVWLSAGVPGLTGEVQIVSIDSSTQLTLSTNNTASFSNQTVAFGYHPNETNFPDTGIKLNVIGTVFTAFANAASSLQIYTRTTTTSRNRLYAQGDVVTSTITVKDADTLDPISGARVYIKAASGGPLPDNTELLSSLTDINGQASFQSYWDQEDQPIAGWVRKASGPPYYKQAIIAGDITKTGFETTTILSKDE